MPLLPAKHCAYNIDDPKVISFGLRAAFGTTPAPATVEADITCGVALVTGVDFDGLGIAATLAGVELTGLGIAATLPGVGITGLEITALVTLMPLA